MLASARAAHLDLGCRSGTLADWNRRARHHDFDGDESADAVRGPRQRFAGTDRRAVGTRGQWPVQAIGGHVRVGQEQTERGGGEGPVQNAVGEER